MLSLPTAATTTTTAANENNNNHNNKYSVYLNELPLENGQLYIVYICKWKWNKMRQLKIPSTILRRIHRCVFLLRKLGPLWFLRWEDNCSKQERFPVFASGYRKRVQDQSMWRYVSISHFPFPISLFVSGGLFALAGGGLTIQWRRWLEQAQGGPRREWWTGTHPCTCHHCGEGKGSIKNKLIFNLAHFHGPIFWLSSNLFLSKWISFLSQRWFWYLSSSIWLSCSFCFFICIPKRNGNIGILYWPGNFNLFFFSRLSQLNLHFSDTATQIALLWSDRWLRNAGGEKNVSQSPLTSVTTDVRHKDTWT